MTELVLGTAQFGSAYGATNAVGRLTDRQVAAVLDVARRGGITTFDTAADYGDSQARLGSLAPAGAGFVTKFSLGDGAPDAHALYRASMAVLGVDALAGVMFHRLSDLDDERAAAAVQLLRDGRDRGEIARAGASIYDADDLGRALAVFPDLDLVQVPGSIVDQRLLDDPRLAAIRERGGQVHVRSAFLQGLLLADPDTLPPYFDELRPAVLELRDRAGTPLGAALRFLRDHDGVDGVVVGATTPDELQAIVIEWEGAEPSSTPLRTAVPAGILDPRGWPAREAAS